MSSDSLSPLADEVRDRCWFFQFVRVKLTLEMGQKQS